MFSVKTIICPKICLGERTYKLVYEISNGTVNSNKGVIRNDTIFDINPDYDYKVIITIVDNNQQTTQQEVSLPICDPIIPTAPLVTSQSICAGEKIQPFTAYTQPQATVDWYSQAQGGTPILVNSLQFAPSSEGVYYAQAQIGDCRSLARSAARLEIKKTLCPIISIRKIKR